MHSCPDCSSPCTCGGDFDDCEAFMEASIFLTCTHCGPHDGCEVCGFNEGCGCTEDSVYCCLSCQADPCECFSAGESA